MTTPDTTITYGLGTLGPTPTEGIRMSTLLAAEEYDDLRLAVAQIRSALRAQTIALVERDFTRLHAYLDELRSAGTDPVRQRTVDWSAAVFELQVALSNWLGAIRLFLDHSRHQLIRRYGKEGAALQAFEEARRAEFDGHFEYRLAYKLRDFCTHVGLPPLDVHVTSNLEDPAGLTLDFDPHVLLRAWGEWKRHVTADLQGLSDPFPIQATVEVAMASVRRIANAALGAEGPVLRAAARTVLDAHARAIDDAQGSTGPFSLMQATRAGDLTQIQLQITPLGPQLAETLLRSLS